MNIHIFVCDYNIINLFAYIIASQY